jgi:tetratricopeptide (TPR) repeat protein
MTLAVQGKLSRYPIFDAALVLIERAYGKRTRSRPPCTRTSRTRSPASSATPGDRALHHRARDQRVAVRQGRGAGRGRALEPRPDAAGTWQAAQGRAHLERALAIREKALGPDDPAVARTAANLGYLLLDEKAYQAALDMFTRVGAILEKRIGADHPARADDLAGVALAWIGLGKPAQAIEPFTRAVALSEQGGGDPVTTASIRAGLARALYASGKDKRGGAAMGRAARVILLEAGETSAVADIDSWLH